MQVFNIYLTDLFCGELNYSYVTKFKVKANTVRGAVHKLARVTGLSFRHYYCGVYHSTNELTGLVVDCDEYPSYDYSNIETI